MDGSFACPECGSPVEIGGMAPGRQVRCDFCHRLVEVPYLPRVPQAGWRRQRFGQWKWVRWAWSLVAVVAALAIVLTGFQFLRRQYRSVQESTVTRLLASSRTNETRGRLDQALVDLDTALGLVGGMDPSSRSRFEPERKRRVELARREAQVALDRISDDHHDPYPLGEWLTLIERAKKDPDLEPIRPKIEQGFHASVRAQSTIELDGARRHLQAGRFADAMNACDRIAALLPHLPKDARDEIRRTTVELVDGLVTTHGVALQTRRGDFVFGSFESYRAHLVPVLSKALEAKGYLPYRETSPWKSAWQRAAYHLQLDVSEHLEGNYLSSNNRLTRIEAHLTLSTGGRIVWEPRPTVRTAVPVPGLSAYNSSRLAVGVRSDELERALYDNARSQIDGKFRQALGHMPDCCP